MPCAYHILTLYSTTEQVGIRGEKNTKNKEDKEDKDERMGGRKERGRKKVKME